MGRACRYCREDFASRPLVAQGRLECPNITKLGMLVESH